MAWTLRPWLTSIKYSFEDTQHLYIVMDFFPGGDLFGIIEKEEGLDEVAMKFYLAAITSGLNDLHILGFVHCDVKPENSLISRSGHVRLVDFRVAARVENGKVVSATSHVDKAVIIIMFVLCLSIYIYIYCST